MRPITAAASARSRIAGPSTSPSGKPTMPARRYTARNANTVATTPHHGVEPPNGDAQRRRAIGALGAATDRDADVAEPEEQAQRREQDGDRDDCDLCRQLCDCLPT